MLVGMMRARIIKMLLEAFPQTYSEELGISLDSGSPGEVFKWFLASLLFGKPIREAQAIKTYRCLARHGLISPRRIIDAGWEKLVQVLDEGGYTRYDFSTADKLLEAAGNLQERYGGDLNLLKSRSGSEGELVERLKGLAKGVGDVTVQIFLRELRHIWNVNPPLSRFTILAAINLGLLETDKPEEALASLRSLWERCRVGDRRFAHLETSLLRLGKNYCRKGRCTRCQFKGVCKISTHRTGRESDNCGP